jgi:uncharacterized protein YdeI (YjbR/CyaY-like superfamily)
VARSAPRLEHGAARRLLQARFGKTEHDLAGIGGRSALLRWIDGIRRSVDEDRYTIRFTPRKARSTWSAVNIKRVADLTKLGRMQPAGVQAFERREEARSQIYAYEERSEAALDEAAEHEFRANERAWTFFQARPPWYRRIAIYWVMTAKKEETRRRRLATLIDDSAHARTLKQLTRPAKPS